MVLLMGSAVYVRTLQPASARTRRRVTKNGMRRFMACATPKGAKHIVPHYGRAVGASQRSWLRESDNCIGRFVNVEDDVAQDDVGDRFLGFRGFPHWDVDGK